MLFKDASPYPPTPSDHMALFLAQALHEYYTAHVAPRDVPLIAHDQVVQTPLGGGGCQRDLQGAISGVLHARIKGLGTSDVRGTRFEGGGQRATYSAVEIKAARGQGEGGGGGSNGWKTSTGCQHDPWRG